MPLPLRSRFASCAVLCALAPLPVAAQSASVRISADSAAQPPAALNPWPQRGWISVGVGGSSSPYHGLAGVAAGWYSVGPIAAGVRLGAADQWFGEQRSDQALLIGARTRASAVFVVGAIGTAKVASSRTCDGPCTAPPPRPSTTEMAYAVEAHANVAVFGLGATMFGTFGPASARYNAFAITLNAGWFGP